MKRRRHTSLLFATLLIPAGASLAHAAEDFTIADLAPEGTIFIIGGDGTGEMCGRFENNPLGALWRTDAVQGSIAESFGEVLQDVTSEFAADGIDLEGMKWPTNLGFAVYTDLDEETGQSRAFVLGYGDWGAEADANGRMMESLMETWRKSDSIDLDSKEIRGREVMILEQISEDDDPADDFGDMDDMMMMFGDPSEMAPDLDTMYMVKDGGRMLMANDLLAIDDALAIFDGDDAKVLAGTDDWRTSMRQLGDPEAYVLLRTGPLQDLLAPMFMGPLGMVEPMIGEMFGDVRGYGFGLEIPEDPGTASMVLSASILMPGDKTGLLGLMRNQDGLGSRPPKVIGEDAIAYGRMNVDFAGLMPLADQISAAIPMGGEEADMMLEQFGPMLSPAFESLGPAMHVMTLKTGSTVLIPTSAPGKVQNMLAMFGPGMEMQPRDFLGETLWTGPDDGPSACIAGNWLLLGEADGVKQVVRGLNADAADQPIAEFGRFNDAIGLMPKGDVVGWGYVDTVEQYAASRENFDGMMAMLGEQDEFAPEMPIDGGALMDGVADLMETMTPRELSRYAGPSVWSFSADDAGWVYRQWFLPPVNVGG
ncbi:MAG: hypothetical protein CMJ27_02235 [Phycisphaerae bacterium]|nr:hypothetical protein [Phycisphaerae bacterium]OUX02875.1 MAG: hypothetical protein CBD91_01560 [Phycisphaeraceae bacterium TMED231]